MCRNLRRQTTRDKKRLTTRHVFSYVSYSKRTQEETLECTLISEDKKSLKDEQVHVVALGDNVSSPCMGQKLHCIHY